ncbi:hypothetical protein QBC38DRAFT_449830 [Podospora fimiseda]|uniref:Fungal N-terminal domain-containing protein n=1 Tax=Podospora fimiseda TaxID=252190 RepID=A0AAN6YL17_9PEZI|nr:hypothetical protein QBC38DRAFT_449830 [Podospora fimiseda]
MDPLSINASVTVLIVAATKITTLLDYLSQCRDSPATIQDAQSKIKHTETAICALQQFLQRVDRKNPRLTMIQVDDLRLNLADAMLALSSFEALVQSLVLMSTLGNTEVLKLNRNSDLKAQESQQIIHRLVDVVLIENAELRQKLADQESVWSVKVSTQRVQRFQNPPVLVTLHKTPDDQVFSEPA